jgi:hypothetical protein
MKSAMIEAPRALFDMTREMKSGYLILARRGRPVAYLFSAAHYDDEDISYMTDPAFWKMIRERRKSDECIPLEEIEAEITRREHARPQRRGSSPRNGRKRK